MSGLRKGKKYNWKDSNLALFGSDTEKNIKSKFFPYMVYNKIRILGFSLYTCQRRDILWDYPLQTAVLSGTLIYHLKARSKVKVTQCDKLAL